MSTEDLERDTVVARALATIAVPDHGPDFWTRLDAALREHEHEHEQEQSEPTGEPEPQEEPEPPELVVVPAATASVFADDADDGTAVDDAAAAPPAADIVLDATPQAEPAARRWGRRVARALIAAAAVAVVAVAGVLIARRDDAGPDLSDETVPTVDGSGTSAPPVTTPAGLAPEEQTVVDFLDALRRGDIDAAAALLGPRSEAYLVAQSGSVDAFLGEATEGLGAWSASPDRKVSLIEDAGGASVVVLEGTITPEGMTEYRRQAFPVVESPSADAYFVDPWALDPEIEDQRIVYTPAPEPGQPLVVHPGDDLEATIAVVGTFRVYVDGELVSEFSASSPSASSASLTIPDDAKDGATVVVVFESESGTTYIADAIAVSAS